MGSVTRMVIEGIQWFWSLPLLGKFGCIVIVVVAIIYLIQRDKRKARRKQSREVE